MEMHFIPARPTGDLRLLDEAIGIAIIGHPAVGMGKYESADGRTLEALRIGRNLRAIGWTPALLKRIESLHEGLKVAEIHVLVQSRETGEFFRVPRTYWFDHDLTVSVLELDPGVPDYAPQLDGQPLVVDASQQDSWLDAAQPGRKAVSSITVSSEQRGTLPGHATPADRRNEEAAHAAAEKVRSGLSVEAASRAVAHMVEAGNRQPESIVAGIRRAHNLMYDRRGAPIRN